MATGQKELQAALRWLGSPVPGSARTIGVGVPWWGAVAGGIVGIVAVRSLLEGGGAGGAGGGGGDPGGSGGGDEFGGLPVDEYAARETTQEGQCDPTEKPGVLAFRRWAIDNWGDVKSPNVKNILRECSVGSPSEHWEGRAWDLMIRDLDHGQAVADALTASDAAGNPNALARRAGIMYMIFNKQMWRAYQQGDAPAGTWSKYTGPNPHTDHVHISFGWPGAMGGTSLYESGVAPLNPANV